MKKSFRLVGLILIAVMSLGLTACGSDDDGGSGGSVNYTSDEIIELLKGKWEVYGHVKRTSSNTDIVENIDGDYTGDIEFKDGQKVRVNSSTIQMVKMKVGGLYQDYPLTLDFFIDESSKYKIIRKNGAAYISFKPDSKFPYDYKIVSLNKNSFKLVMDEVKQAESDGVSYTLHYEITVISK